MNLVIDYGMGNLRSVVKALEEIDEPVELIDDPRLLKRASRIILPGVGAFGKGMENIRQMGWAEALDREVIERKKPFLGICLGMQLLLDKSFEKGEHEGLGWIKGDVSLLSDLHEKPLRLPHMGWNDIIVREVSELFSDLPPKPTFYFVHSFFTDCKDNNVVLASCDYGADFPVVIRQDNIFACQFHPEKSHNNGLTFLKNFIRITDVM